jgi:hypothetical protein
MDDRQADLFVDSGLAGADRFDILLIKHDVIGPRREVKYALLGRGNAMEQTQKQPPLLPDCGDGWFGGISSTRTATLRTTAEFLWERVERLLDYLDEMFTLHPLPTETNKCTLIPSNRRRLCRHHRHHLLCRRLRLLLLPLALVEGVHRQRPTDQKGLSRGILDSFCSCPIVRLVLLGKRRRSQGSGGRNCSHREPGALLHSAATPTKTHCLPLD